MTADEALTGALRALSGALAELGAPAMIIGGIAVIARGVPTRPFAWRDRDRADIERLIVRHGSAMDLARVRRVVGELAAALDEPERVAMFDALVRRALEPPH